MVIDVDPASRKLKLSIKPSHFAASEVAEPSDADEIEPDLDEEMLDAMPDDSDSESDWRAAGVLEGASFQLSVITPCVPIDGKIKELTRLAVWFLSVCSDWLTQLPPESPLTFRQQMCRPQAWSWVQVGFQSIER